MIGMGANLRPIGEIDARRAVAGVDVDMIEQAGVSPKEADAVAAALRQFLVGDLEGARQTLGTVFVNGTIDEIIAEFGSIPDDIAA